MQSRTRSPGQADSASPLRCGARGHASLFLSLPACKRETPLPTSQPAVESQAHGRASSLPSAPGGPAQHRAEGGRLLGGHPGLPGTSQVSWTSPSASHGASICEMRQQFHPPRGTGCGVHSALHWVQAALCKHSSVIPAFPDFWAIDGPVQPELPLRGSTTLILSTCHKGSCSL